MLLNQDNSDKYTVYYVYMFFFVVLHHYFIWHYSRAFGQILHLAKNFIWFTIHFFSLPQLTLSLFAPWRRITTERGQRFSLEDLAGYLIVNLISRIIGLILRTVVIILGMSVLCFIVIGTLSLYVAWTLAPLLIIANLYIGLRLLI